MERSYVWCLIVPGCTLAEYSGRVPWQSALADAAYSTTTTQAIRENIPRDMFSNVLIVGGGGVWAVCVCVCGGRIATMLQQYICVQRLEYYCIAYTHHT